MVTPSPGPRFGAIAAIVLALLLPTSAARGDANTAAIVISGKVDQGTFNLVEVAIEQYLRERGWSIKGGGSDAVDPSAVASCVAGDKSECVAQLLAPLGVEKVVLATAKSEKAKDGEETVVVMAWILAAKDGSVIVSDRRYCERCSPDLLEATTVDLMAGLLRDMRTREGHAAIRIRSTPPGAVITLDGERVGVTDMEFGVAPGPHRVSVQKDGYRTEDRDVDTPAGETVKVEFTLKTHSDSSDSRRSGEAWKWVVGVTGVVAVAGGVVLLSADGPVVQGDHRGFVRSETTLSGVVLTTAGVITVGISGYLFYRDRRKPSTMPSVAIDRNQVSLQLVGTF